MAGLMEEVASRGCWEDLGELSEAEGLMAGASAAVPADDFDARLARLVRAIEEEVVPRVVLARRGAQAQVGAGDGVPTADEVAAFAQLALTHDAATVTAQVDLLRARGASLESIFLRWLAPAARRLGDLWAEDACDFTQVTIGLWRLHQVLHKFAPGAATGSNVRRRALVVPLPGEQHSFGAAMVADFLRRAGWSVWSGPLATSEDLIALVRTEWYALIGLSVSGEVRLSKLPRLVRAVRRASRNRGVAILVGGQVFNDRPELVGRVGADATAADARQAVACAEDLFALLGKNAGPAPRAAALGPGAC